MSNPGDTEQLDARLREAARRLAYPQTPDIAGRARRRLEGRERRPGPRLRRAALAAALLLLAALLAVPEVRAAAIRLLQIGVVRIRVEPAPTASPPAPSPRPTAAPASLGLAGETTLAEAARLVDFAVRLPAYPADLGPPDRVFLQDLGGDALVLVWLDPADPARARLSLEILSSRMFVEKTLYGDEVTVLAETQVGADPALWVRGPHLLVARRAGREEIELRRLVPGDALIWTSGGLTYRLESGLGLAEARRVAESLR